MSQTIAGFYDRVKQGSMPVQQAMWIMSSTVPYVTNSFNILKQETFEALAKDLIVHVQAFVEAWAPESVKQNLFPGQQEGWDIDSLKRAMFATIKAQGHEFGQFNEQVERNRLECVSDALMQLNLFELLQTFDFVVDVCLDGAPLPVPNLKAHIFRACLRTTNNGYDIVNDLLATEEVVNGAAARGLHMPTTAAEVESDRCNPSMFSHCTAQLLRERVATQDTGSFNLFVPAALAFLDLKSYDIYGRNPASATKDYAKMAKEFA